MKRFLLILLALGFGVSVFAQYRAIQKNRDVISLGKKQTIDNAVPGNKPDNFIVSNRSVMDDPQVIMTTYDLMTNSASGHQRFLYWPDGTMSATTTFAQDQTSAYPGRGTGYNYFNGTTWGTPPTTKLESVRTGWPSIQPYGPNGECIVSHQSGTLPMIFLKRDTKGTGAWTQSEVPSVTGETAMLWPRMVTNGANHMNIHIIAMTPPTGNGGTVWNGMDGALLYVRSTDGGATWGNWQQLTGMTTAEYLAFSGDSYAWAMPHGDTLAFVSSDAWIDTFVMKSTDNGTTWTKTIVYNSPYNLEGTGAQSPNFFYAPDGTSTIALDKNGNVHVAFGLGADSLYATAGYYYYRAFTQGVVYWNESMPMLRQDLDPDSLFANNQLVGWVLDTMIYYQGSSPDYALASYSISLTGQVGMSIDNDNNLFLIWTCPTVNLDPDGWMLRHIFERTATLGTGNSVVWNDNINDLNSDFLYTNTECMYPELAQLTSADKFYVMFMADDYAGAYMKGLNVTDYAGQTAITENYQTILSVDKTSVGVGIGDKNKKDVTSFKVSPNYPNPFRGTTSIGVTTQKAGNLSIDVTNLTGQKVISINKGFTNAGSYRYSIDCSQLSAGVYFYTVTLNNESRTMKMIVN